MLCGTVAVRTRSDSQQNHMHGTTHRAKSRKTMGQVVLRLVLSYSVTISR
jgi:hypothetical protein